MSERTILMYDMDMYFANVMIRDNPELKGKPLVIGALPSERGVVATASYEARKCGVKSGMSSYEAYKNCPHAIFMHPNMSAIIATSEKIREVVKDYSDIIEFVALDEAYIDITNTKQLFYKGDITLLAMEIKKRIFEVTQCTATIGIGYSKYAAKLASEQNKPNGFGKIMDKKVLLDIITDKNVRIIHGIGEQMEKRLNEFRIFKVKDLQMKPLEFMKEHFGVYGIFLHYMSWGIDDREIVPYFEEVGIGNSRTLDYNVYGIDEIKKAMIPPLKMACYRLKNLGKYTKNVQIKLRYGDFVTITRAKQLKYPINTPSEVYKEVCNLLETKVDNYSNIRLVGLRLSSFTETKTKQFNLFDNPVVWKKKNILDDIAYTLRKEHGYDIVKDALGVELNKKKGDEKNGYISGGFESLRNYRTIKCLESLYRRT